MHSRLYLTLQALCHGWKVLQSGVFVYDVQASVAQSWIPKIDQKVDRFLFTQLVPCMTVIKHTVKDIVKNQGKSSRAPLLSEKLEPHSNWTVITCGSHVMREFIPSVCVYCGVFTWHKVCFYITSGCSLSKWVIRQITDMTDFHGIRDTDNLCYYCIRNQRQVSGNTSSAEWSFICCWQVSGLKVSHDLIGSGLHYNYHGKPCHLYQSAWRLCVAFWIKQQNNLPSGQLQRCPPPQLGTAGLKLLYTQ